MEGKRKKKMPFSWRQVRLKEIKWLWFKQRGNDPVITPGSHRWVLSFLSKEQAKPMQPGSWLFLFLDYSRELLLEAERQIGGRFRRKWWGYSHIEPALLLPYPLLQKCKWNHLTVLFNLSAPGKKIFSGILFLSLNSGYNKPGSLFCATSAGDTSGNQNLTYAPGKECGVHRCIPTSLKSKSFYLKGHLAKRHTISHSSSEISQ